MTTIPMRDQVIMAMAESYPELDLFGVYCLATGKLIGTNYESEELCRTLTGDAEEIADDIALRILASMRPGLMWNKLRLNTVNEMRKSHPVDTCAWLMNRLMTHPEYRGDTLALHHDRIKLHQWLTMNQDTANALLPILIDIDARLSLNRLESPITVGKIIEQPTGEAVVKSFTDWQATIEKRIADQLAARDMETKFFRDGNTLSRQASISQFWESKPETATAAVKREKREDSAFMANILDAMLNTEPTGAIAEAASQSVSGLTIPSMDAITAAPTLAIKRVISFGKKA